MQKKVAGEFSALKDSTKQDNQFLHALKSGIDEKPPVGRVSSSPSGKPCTTSGRITPLNIKYNLALALGGHAKFRADRDPPKNLQYHDSLRQTLRERTRGRIQVTFSNKKMKRTR